VTDSLSELKPRSKAARFRLLLPTIETKIKAGVEHAQIIEALAKVGLDLTPGTYFNYLKRSRLRAAAGKAPPQATVAVANEAPQFKQPQRPPTFDYDPTGKNIQDLLK
jgi:hypothetical protein